MDKKIMLAVMFLIGLAVLGIYFYPFEGIQNRKTETSELKRLIHNYGVGTTIKLDYGKLEKLADAELEEFANKLENLSEKDATWQGKLASIYAKTAKLELLKREFDKKYRMLQSSKEKACDKIGEYKELATTIGKIKEILNELNTNIGSFKKSYASVAEEIELKKIEDENIMKNLEVVETLIALLEVKCSEVRR